MYAASLNDFFQHKSCFPGFNYSTVLAGFKLILIVNIQNSDSNKLWFANISAISLSIIDYFNLLLQKLFQSKKSTLVC